MMILQLKIIKYTLNTYFCPYKGEGVYLDRKWVRGGGWHFPRNFQTCLHNEWRISFTITTQSSVLITTFPKYGFHLATLLLMFCEENNLVKILSKNVRLKTLSRDIPFIIERHQFTITYELPESDEFCLFIIKTSEIWLMNYVVQYIKV